MSVFMIFDDFQAMMLSPPNPMREVAIERDAWPKFATFDGSAREFKAAMLLEKPHWFSAPAVETPEHDAFYSLAAQGAYVRKHGEVAARELLATEGLKLGSIKAPVKEDAVKGSNNPYDTENFKGTEAQREARIQSLIKSSAMLATQLARSAGKTITGQPLNSVGGAGMQRR